MNLDAERQRLLGLAEKATPGPWSVGSKSGARIWADDGPTLIADVKQSIFLRDLQITDNAAFIAAAHDMAALIRAQAAEIERLRADSERYRWLRGRHWNDGGLYVLDNPDKRHNTLGLDAPSGVRLDAAIDAAIAAERKGAV